MSNVTDRARFEGDELDDDVDFDDDEELDDDDAGLSPLEGMVRDGMDAFAPDDADDGFDDDEDEDV